MLTTILASVSIAMTLISIFFMVLGTVTVARNGNELAVMVGLFIITALSALAVFVSSVAGF